jgi:hypothetical protein
MVGNISSWFYGLFCCVYTEQLRLQTPRFGPKSPSFIEVLEGQ